MIRNRVHQRLMGIAAVHAVLRKPGSGLKPLNGSLRLAAEVTVRTIPGQAVPQLEQEFLKRLHIRTLVALLQGSGSQRVLARRGIGFCRTAARKHRVAIIHEGQLIPVRPLARRDLRFHAAVVEAALLHGVAAADVHAHMPVKAQRHAGHLG